jgi:hypothetical protein
VDEGRSGVTEMLKDELEALKGEVADLPLDPRGSALVDEFLDEHEFELALHVICDFLLDKKRGTPSELVLQRIESLHSRMGLTDDCVARLRHRLSDIDTSSP